MNQLSKGMRRVRGRVRMRMKDDRSNQKGHSHMVIKRRE